MNVYGLRERRHVRRQAGGPISMVEQGCYTLVNGGLSPSNTVYVDNVVEAIILAIKEDTAVGHALTISDNKTISWRTFFSSYIKMLPHPYPLLGITQSALRAERARQKLEDIKHMLLNPMQISSILPYLENESSGLDFLISLIKKTKITKLANFSSNNLRASTIPSLATEDISCPSKLPKIPEIWLEKTFILPFQFSIKGATDILGFKPQISFEEGMRKTEKWLNGNKGGLPMGSQIFAVPELLV